MKGMKYTLCIICKNTYVHFEKLLEEYIYV